MLKIEHVNIRISCGYYLFQEKESRKRDRKDRSIEPVRSKPVKHSRDDERKREDRVIKVVETDSSRRYDDRSNDDRRQRTKSRDSNNTRSRDRSRDPRDNDRAQVNERSRDKDRPRDNDRSRGNHEKSREADRMRDEVKAPERSRERKRSEKASSDKHEKRDDGKRPDNRPRSSHEKTKSIEQSEICIERIDERNGNSNGNDVTTIAHNITTIGTYSGASSRPFNIIIYK